MLVSDGDTELLQQALLRVEQSQPGLLPMSATRTFPALLEAFFTDGLIRQRQASPSLPWRATGTLSACCSPMPDDCYARR